MAPNDKAGRVVFIGNIPYGGTEELIVDTLSRVGQVLNFRLVYDKETGRPKGFGFAEFADADAAASAVRNLNDYEVMGRKLRVDWSNDNGAGDAAPASYTAPPAPTNGQPEPALAPSSSALPPLPPGVDLPPNITCPDAISRTLNTLPAPQLLDILSQMKGLVTTDPAKATELLRQAPQLAYAIFQSLLLLNLVDTNSLGQFIDQGTSAPPAAAAPAQQPPAPQPPRNFPVYPPQPVPTPPTHVQPPAPAYNIPPPTQAPQPPQPAMDQGHLYAMIMNMPQSDIDQLPPDQRAQIMQIRQGLIQQAGAR
ncbi:uncharacterized protein BDR25DRAFT_275792 [Lindgomyces ingoldianus]|uniref:Uncharacterized protein n=1 Tax=Lindgomyces ingoldianus TaxID=673940 RepID=A0ACB6RFP6_9PLEO|nr:uncharacterized protein BDR25DRAFT_275792 [Lindgomyces ingoldianus]KAF2478079.1 hypothetical protein BDR25DRAFT_275792 [Lindgomyces ingoldianus]